MTRAAVTCGAIEPLIHYTRIERGGVVMYGVFGGYTRWAVVFLIIFVLFILLVPYGTTTTCTTTPVY
ncbi:hypothetical protein Alches_10270 [Alicyclobacillus hesperidum subsp. aegles]|nr:hypothetical protein Alches_10270 [Alicyclobacillus hesperidum subsp. aegles]